MENQSPQKAISFTHGIVGLSLQIFCVFLLVKLIPASYDTVEGTSIFYHDDNTIFYAWPIFFSLFIFYMFFQLFNGYVVLEPNETMNFSFLGKYKGKLTHNGWSFVNPFFGKRRWSTKTDTHKTNIIKVSDKGGSPIEIGATIVYNIEDTYKAQYDVEDFTSFTNDQFEVAVRQCGKSHTYSELSAEKDSKSLMESLKELTEVSGINIKSAKLSHLNYAVEIAPAMLQVQQAGAISEARKIIVDNAVEMAKSASEHIPNMSDSSKGQFISDLVLVLCSEKQVTPTITIGNTK